MIQPMMKSVKVSGNYVLDHGEVLHAQPSCFIGKRRVANNTTPNPRAGG